MSWPYYALFAFFATFAVYNGQRLIKSAQPPETTWLKWVKRNERLLLFAIGCASIGTIGSLFLVGKIGWMAAVWLAFSGIISFFYVVRVKGVNMRELPYIKIHLIAFAWVTVLILFPTLNEGSINESIMWVSIAHYLYFVAVAIPFDIRDLKFDKDTQKTIPQVVGMLWAKVSSLVLFILFFALMCWQIPALIVSPTFYIAVLVQFVLVFFMNESRGDLYCAGLIDGGITLLGVSYFLL